MTAEQRASVLSSFKGMISAARGMGELDLSRKATMGAINMFVLGAATGQSLADHLKAARTMAPKIGRYVDALVSAL